MGSISRKVLMIGVLFATVAHGESAPTSAGEPPLDQVVIEATRTNLVKLAKEIQQSEHRFYKRYNQLNKNRDYAIQCTTEATTGSRFTQTDCQPVFQNKAEEEEARQFLMAFGGGDQVTGTPDGVTGPLHVNAPPPPPSAPAGGSVMLADSAIAARRPDFRKNMIEVTARSPELTKMAQEHAELWKRYWDMYRKLNGSPPPPKAQPPEKSPAPGEAAPPADAR